MATIIKKIIYRIIRLFSVIKAIEYKHYVVMGSRLNLKTPKTLNDKLQWLNLNYKNTLMTECADKYNVRQYVKECGYENILNELYGIYNKSNEIDWKSLPNKFVLKCNHGCGFNIICKDKNKLNKKKTVRLLHKLMKMDFSKRLNERHYKYIFRKILCEKYIEGTEGKLPKDYKIYCFNGCPKIILIAQDRESNLKYGLFDLDWNILPYLVPSDDASHELNSIANKPECIFEMLECAKKLSEPFPFVRIDFYVNENKLIFGEMTFTPSGCIEKYNRNGCYALGDMLDIKNLILNKSIPSILQPQ